jgi:hypothetical protein
MVHQFINEGGTPNSVPAVLSVIEPYTYASINSSGKAGPPIELVKSIIEKKSRRGIKLGKNEAIWSWDYD